MRAFGIGKMHFPIRCTYPTAALWNEVDGVHVDESTSVLWYLKLATSYLSVASHACARSSSRRDGRRHDRGPFSSSPRGVRAVDTRVHVLHVFGSVPES